MLNFNLVLGARGTSERIAALTQGFLEQKKPQSRLQVYEGYQMVPLNIIEGARKIWPLLELLAKSR